MIQILRDSKHVHTISAEITKSNLTGFYGIVQDHGGNLHQKMAKVNGQGISTTTRLIREPMIDSSGAKKIPLIVLAHELQHVFDNDQGVFQGIIKKDNKGLYFSEYKKNPATKVFIHEERAVRTGNIVRKLLGMKIRKTYGNLKIENPCPTHSPLNDLFKKDISKEDEKIIIKDK